MDCGAVWLTRGKKTQRLRRAKRNLKKGDQLHVYYDSAVLSEAVPAPELIADVGEYSVWDKPCRMLAQGSKWGDHCTVARYAEKALAPERNAFPVHRLDRAASGLILIAHSKRVAAELSLKFRERQMSKFYWVRVEGQAGRPGTEMTISDELDGKAAKTFLRVSNVDLTTDTSLLDVQIESGRKHQIRRHLAELAYPVVGDRLYGTGRFEVDLCLRAYCLSFLCPVSGETVSYRVDERDPLCGENAGDPPSRL